MANELKAVMPRILAMALKVLRTNCVLPQVVMMDVRPGTASFGQSIDVPYTFPGNVGDMSPSANNPTTEDVSPGFIQVPLNKWKHASFYLTDQEQTQLMSGYFERQVEQKAADLAESVSKDIANIYKEVYNYTDEQASSTLTVPFTGGNTKVASQAGKILTENKASRSNRLFVMNPATEAQAQGLRAFQDASYSSDTGTIRDGMVGRKLGFDFYCDQQMPTHTTTGGANFAVNQSDFAVGDTEVTVDTGTTAPAAGDIFTVAGDTQTYVIRDKDEGGATLTNSATKFNFRPAAKVAWADDAEITFKPSHSVNLAFQRDAIVFAIRSLGDIGTGLGPEILTLTDDKSMIPLRLEVARENARVRWRFDILYGYRVVRPENVVRVGSSE